MTAHLTPNMEMYLKTILEIADGGDAPRVKAIAERLGVTMPSVSGAVDTLQRRGLVEHAPYGAVRLTSKGSRVAREVKDRNELIYQFLLEVLQLPEPIASRDACVLEHVVSPKTLDRISVFLEFTRACPCTGERALTHFEQWLTQPGAKDACLACEKEGAGR